MDRQKNSFVQLFTLVMCLWLVVMQVQYSRCFSEQLDIIPSNESAIQVELLYGFHITGGECGDILGFNEAGKIVWGKVLGASDWVPQFRRFCSQQIGNRFIYTDFNTIYSLDVATGETLWQKEVPSTVSVLFVDSDGTIYTSHYYQDLLYVIDADGKMLFQTENFSNQEVGWISEIFRHEDKIAILSQWEEQRITLFDPFTQTFEEMDSQDLILSE